jgi:asparagine synthase (glutamine-hydrolysing)
MCGIVGIAGPHDPAWVQRMNSTIVHRGPDDAGTYASPDGLVSLAMRRLSIIDLHGGHQPMSNEDGTVWIVFNGEIFNAPDIRPSLERRGHRFTTANSDTEVLLHLYEEKGPAALDDLNGMFAFVLYDRSRNLLFGARDRMGIKPLYYWKSADRLVFGSELKSLLALPFIERAIDHQSLFHYMTLLHVPDEASIIKGVCRIPPAHSFTYHLGSRDLVLQKYWEPRFDRPVHRSDDEWASILRTELRNAVRRWSLSDVPIACSLSGGIDSAAVVGLLAEQGHSQIKTYSLGFRAKDEQGWNEVDLARQVARRWGTDHHEIMLEPTELLADLVRMVWYLDEPYAGGLPSWYVFREMGRDVKVGMTGTGGDELFGNYGKFSVYETTQPARAITALRNWSRSGVDAVAGLMSPLAALANQLPASWRFIGRGRGLAALPSMVSSPFGHYYHAHVVYLSDTSKRAHVLRTDHAPVRDTAHYLQNLYDATRSRDIRDGLAAVDFRTQLAEEFLFMTDRFSMAHSLEARVPFLDHVLVETAFGIPASARTRTGDLKYLLKRAVADLLPPELLTAPKRGFVIPIQLWLRGELRPLVERLLDPDRLRRQGLFQPEFHGRFVVPHMTAKADYTWQLWAALMFQLWHVVFIEQKETGVPGYGWEAVA